MVHLGYESSIKNFLKDNENQIIGKIISDYKHDLNDEQEYAWRSQITILKEQLSQFPKGNILFEYKIPRMGSEIDNVLLLDGLIFIIEFKVGENTYKNEYLRQVEKYAYLLHDFHLESRDKIIVPILVSTEGENLNNSIKLNENKIFNIIKCNKNNLSNTISKICNHYKTNFNLDNWSKSKYAPTKGILESARKLYETHEVPDIETYNAEDLFLYETEETIDDIINSSKANNKKSIIFVTGVPGAGKTLIGLNIATKRSVNNDEDAVFLSGNGPLVNVLREALARDSAARNNIKKEDAMRKVKSFIQPIHNFRDESLRDNIAPHENIVIFDESQRAWTLEKTENFMKRKHGIENFGMSEPEFLISIMDLRTDWAVIICLVGQGQEINTGEAGITEWFKALQNNYPHWDVYAHKQSLDLNDEFNELNIDDKKHLYLYSTIRSLDAPNLPNFIEYLLNNDKDNAKKILKEFNNEYPLYLTRNLEDAKAWIKKISSKEHDDSLRYGLLAQSNALRLRPEGIFVKKQSDPNWFLNETEDIRSSNHLEIPATEFEIQGLEIDYSIMCWDANLRYNDGKFLYRRFRGSRWEQIKQEQAQDYLINSYRVLLTRARRGMVIFVPKGDDEDKTRPSKYYDETYEYLKSLGIKELTLKNEETN